MGARATKQTFATFVCTICGHVFAERIPAIFEDLPTCPLCYAASVIQNLLDVMPWS